MITSNNHSFVEDLFLLFQISGMTALSLLQILDNVDFFYFHARSTLRNEEVAWETNDIIKGLAFPQPRAKPV
jgi:hypothetical protein